MLLGKGMPPILMHILRVTNLLNQHIDSPVPRQAKGALFFLVAGNLLWTFIQILSNYATDKEHKVCQVLVVVASTWCCRLCNSLFMCFVSWSFLPTRPENVW
jgi:hypothetical protein